MTRHQDEEPKLRLLVSSLWSTIWAIATSAVAGALSA